MENINNIDEICVDVIMSVFNAEKTISEAIDSMLNQTHHKIRLIICNDASTDGTNRILEKYKKNYPDKIILIENKTNKRLAYSLNKCLELVESPYVARMDGDDISEPQRIEKQLSFMKMHPEYDVVGTGMISFTEDNPALQEKHPVINPDRYTLRNQVPYHHATILAKTSMYQRLGGYTVAERTKTGQDYDMWFRFYAAGMKGANIDEPLYKVREDVNTFKRRTFQYRFNEYKTTLFGYKLLHYPLLWYIKPTLALAKGLVPPKLAFKLMKLVSKNERQV